MHFEATVFNFTEARKANLNTYIELQEFMVEMERKGFVDARVRAFDSEGLKKTKYFAHTGIVWEEISQLRDHLHIVD